MTLAAWMFILGVFLLGFAAGALFGGILRLRLLRGLARETQALKESIALQESLGD